MSFFLELRYSPLEFNSRKSRQHLTREKSWNKSDELWISLFGWRFRGRCRRHCLSSLIIGHCNWKVSIMGQWYLYESSFFRLSKICWASFHFICQDDETVTFFRVLFIFIVNWQQNFVFNLICLLTERIPLSPITITVVRNSRRCAINSKGLSNVLIMFSGFLKCWVR